MVLDVGRTSRLHMLVPIVQLLPSAANAFMLVFLRRPLWSSLDTHETVTVTVTHLKTRQHYVLRVAQIDAKCFFPIDPGEEAMSAKSAIVEFLGPDTGIVEWLSLRWR